MIKIFNKTLDIYLKNRYIRNNKKNSLFFDKKCINLKEFHIYMDNEKYKGNKYNVYSKFT
jgi:hypothetical protein